MHRAQRQPRQGRPGDPSRPAGLLARRCRLLALVALFVMVSFSGCLQKGGIQRFDPATDTHPGGVQGPHALNMTVKNVGNQTLEVTWTLTHPSGHIAEAQQSRVAVGETYVWNEPLKRDRIYRLFYEVVVMDAPEGSPVTITRDLWGDDCPADSVHLHQTVDTDATLPTEIRATTKYGFCV